MKKSKNNNDDDKFFKPLGEDLITIVVALIIFMLIYAFIPDVIEWFKALMA